MFEHITKEAAAVMFFTMVSYNIVFALIPPAIKERREKRHRFHAIDKRHNNAMLGILIEDVKWNLGVNMFVTLPSLRDDLRFGRIRFIDNGQHGIMGDEINGHAPPINHKPNQRCE